MNAVYLYGSLLTLTFVALSIRTIRLRRRLHIAIGDGSSAVMLRAMRAQANFAEYVPLGLLLMFFVTSAGAPILLVHFLGLALLIGRGLHGVGLSQLEEDYRFRVAGMALTFTSLVLSAVYLLFRSVLTFVG